MRNLFIVFILIFVSQTFSASALYQDQIGKFDWRKRFVGIPQFVYHHPSSNNVIVGTHSNVIASIHVRDGSIIWRHLLPKECVLNHMSILRSSEDTSEYLVKTGCSSLGSGSANKEQFATWNPQTGLLVSDSRYKEFLEDDQAESVKADLGHLVSDSRSFPLTESSDLIVSEDGSVSLMTHEQIIWSREESLASIIAVEIVKLPIENRDKFGLQKTIVAVTRTGKIFGIDTISGEIVWHLFDKQLASSELQAKYIKLMILKQSDISSTESSAVVIHPSGLIVHLNPIIGKFLEKKSLPMAIKQVASTELYDADSDPRRGVIILDTKDQVIIYPDDLAQIVQDNIQKYFMTIIDRVPSPSLKGYRFTLVNKVIVPDEAWSLTLNETETIVSVNIKRIDEETHSPARVLGDRGILYKYDNPNVIAIMTEGNSGHLCNPEQSVNVYLVDGVTGALVHSIHHQKARGPTKMVHSENWLVYSYYNYKSRRVELSSLEMFEGVDQVNSSVFSSKTRSHIKPKLIEHKSFIFPSGINAMVDTTTLRGMTNRHIIVALPSGSLLEIPKIFLDPRRPINMMTEHREEGLIPYMPELPIPSESIINYDQTLLSVDGLVTSPAMLESTSLVFSYGLDLFFTRVTPSKTFDILKDDFDHLLISGVLLFLTVASLGTKYLAQRKALHAAWK